MRGAVLVLCGVAVAALVVAVGAVPQPQGPPASTALDAKKQDSKAVAVSAALAPDAKAKAAPAAAQQLAQSSFRFDHPTIAKVFYINLDRDEERRKHMDSVLSSEGLDFERVPGVTVQDLHDHKYDELFPHGVLITDVPDDSQLARSAACDVAHRAAFKKVADQGDSSLYLVMEDDVAFEAGWKDRFAQKWNSVPDDWVMARIGMWGKTSNDDKVNDNWYRANRHVDGWDENNAYYYGAHAIVLTPFHARRLLEKLKGFKADHADRFTADGVVGSSYVLVDNLVVVDEKVWGSTKNDVEGEKHTPSFALREQQRQDELKQFGKDYKALLEQSEALPDALPQSQSPTQAQPSTQAQTQPSSNPAGDKTSGK